MRWALHNSALNVAMEVLGCRHELGLIVRLVLDGFLYTVVAIFPLASRVRKTSKNAIDLSFSSSLVNCTLG